MGHVQSFFWYVRGSIGQSPGPKGAIAIKSAQSQVEGGDEGEGHGKEHGREPRVTWNSGETPGDLSIPKKIDVVFELGYQ